MGMLSLDPRILLCRRRCRAAVAQSVERVLGKDEVMGPNPISSSMQVWQAVGLADNRIAVRWQGRLRIAVLRKVF